MPDGLAHLDEALVAQERWVQQHKINGALGDFVSREPKRGLVIIIHKLLAEQVEALVILKQKDRVRRVVGLINLKERC